MHRIEISVKGMTCGGCQRSVEGALRRVPGVAEVSVDLAAGRARVELDSTEAGLDALLAAVDAAGFDAGPWPPSTPAG